MATTESGSEPPPPLRLVGEHAPVIEALGGVQAVDPHLQQIIRDLLPSRDEHTHRLFTGAWWIFSWDGTFCFIPPPTADVRDDLFPIMGTYVRDGLRLTFHSTHQTTPEHSVSLDGIVDLDTDVIQLEVIYGISTMHVHRFAKVSQPLSDHHTVAEQVSDIAGISVPSIFQIVLEGQLDQQECGPLTGTLKLLPRYAADPNPFMVTLVTEARQGSCLRWYSYTAHQTRQGEINSLVQVTDKQIRLETTPAQKVIDGIAWSVPVQNPYLPDIISEDARATLGSLTFTISGDGVTGSLSIEGLTLSGARSTYMAQFAGHRQSTSPTEPQVFSASAKPSSASPEVTEHSATTAISAPALYIVTMNGATEAGPFEPLSGNLFVMPSEPDDTNPYSLTLTTDGPIRHGWINWSSYVHHQIGIVEHNLEMKVGDGQIDMQVQPSDHTRGLTWFTRGPHDEPTDSYIGVHVEQGSCSLTFTGEHVAGQIQAGGVLISDLKQPSLYSAQITGVLQERPAVRSISTTAILNLSGRWASDEHSFGWLDLEHTATDVIGIYSGRGAGQIAGTVQGAQIDFTWQGTATESSSGWAFARLTPDGSLLIGMWGTHNDQRPRQVLVATRDSPALLGEQALTVEDATELRYLGQQLAGQGKCGQAIELLERALTLYQLQRAQSEGPSIWQEQTLISEVMALNYLAPCALTLGDYDRLLGYLRHALSIQRLLAPQPAAIGIFSHYVDEVLRDLTATHDLLETFQAGITSLAQRVPQDHSMLAGTIAILFGRVNQLRGLVDEYRQSLIATKTSVIAEQEDAVQALQRLPAHLSDLRVCVRKHIDDLVGLMRQPFGEQTNLLSVQASLFACVRVDTSAGALRLNIREAQSLEDLLKSGLRSTTALTNDEKWLFDTHTELVVFLISWSANLLLRAEQPVYGQGMAQFETRQMHMRDFGVRLTTYIEQWRAQLLTDLDKIAVQERTEPFLYQLVRFLFDLKSASEAFHVGETIRSRSLVDLLAIQPDLHRRLGQVYAQDQLLLSPDSVPVVSFKEIQVVLRTL